LATIGNDEVEIEARIMLREMIERTAWFHHRMSREQRQDTIEQDIDRHWPLFVSDAAQRLVDRVTQDVHAQGEFRAEDRLGN
jgi:hypothetical protein